MKPHTMYLPSLRYSSAVGKVHFATDQEMVEIEIPGASERFRPEAFSLSHTILGSGEQRWSGDDFQHYQIGESSYVRDVYHWITSKNGIEGGLRIGLTVHAGAGTQSSLPHDFELTPTRGFEEVFFYMIEGGRQRAIQVGTGLWHDGTDVDAAWVVRDHEFSAIPMGYHPVLAEPTSQVAYVWAYICASPEWEKAL